MDGPLAPTSWSATSRTKNDPGGAATNSIDLADRWSPHDEFNVLEKGKHYGWPILHEKNVYKELIRVPQGQTVEQWKQKSTPMTLGYDAHAAPLQRWIHGDPVQVECSEGAGRRPMA
mgnify:CR=1 FL=1